LEQKSIFRQIAAAAPAWLRRTAHGSGWRGSSWSERSYLRCTRKIRL